ncbi:hypothetical protein M0804_002728 [Polistes exclamans]|nr:hypothetical protein M0804_002728 [Polistes exclamans]
MEPGNKRTDEKNLEENRYKNRNLILTEEKEEISTKLRVHKVDKLTTIEQILLTSSSSNKKKDNIVAKHFVEEKEGGNNKNNNIKKKKENLIVRGRTSFPSLNEKIKPIKLIKRPTIGTLVVKGLDPKNLVIKEDKEDRQVSDENDQDILIKKEQFNKNRRSVDNEDDEDEEKKCKQSPLDRLEESRSKIKVLQDNLGTQIQAITALSYNEELSNRPLRSSVEIDTNSLSEISFDPEFLQRQRLDERLEIEESHRKPRYSKKVLEIERRWSGEFLRCKSGKNHDRSNSSSSSKSSYVEEFGSVSSGESITEEGQISFSNVQLNDQEGSSIRHSEEFLEGSTVSTLGSDSGLDGEDKKLVNEDINHRSSDRSFEEDLSRINERLMIPCEHGNQEINYKESSSSIATANTKTNTKDGYAKLIREFTMEPGVSRVKKEEKQKKKSGLRRLLPGFFSPKDSRKDYNKKKERKERRKQDERHFTRYQQNGNYTRSPDTMNLNEDIKRNVKLDNSLNGSIIEERLDEIKRELFPDQGLITSTPDHFSLNDEGRTKMIQQTKYRANDSSPRSIGPDDRWYDRKILSPDNSKYEERSIAEDGEIKTGLELDNRRIGPGGQLERKHSLQEANRGRMFFQRNHGPSGRISAPPTERFFHKSRIVRPMDRPLPAIPRSRIELCNYENDEREESQELESRGENDDNEVSRQAVSIVIDSPNDRTLKYSSPVSSQKSGDYADSCCTPNSSQKSEFSPSSSKSGEYYLNSPRTSARTSPTTSSIQTEGIYANDTTRPSKNPDFEEEIEERVYDETPPSPFREDDSVNRKEGDVGATNKTLLNSKKSLSSPRGMQRKAQPGDQILIASPKREVIYDRKTFANLERIRPESPITVSNSSKERIESNFSKGKEYQEGQRNRDKIQGHRSASLPPFSMIPTASGNTPCTMKNLQRPEPVYATSRLRTGSSPRRRNVNDVSGPATSVSSQEKIYTSKGSLQREPISERQRPTEGNVYHGQVNCPINCNPTSPTKRRTMQHLEAFYWQQKALEANRKTGLPAANNNDSPIRETTNREKQTSLKINLPEIREAVYWQQLKKLDEEQQRRIYERNLMEDRRLDNRSVSNRQSGRSSIRQPVPITNTNIPVTASTDSNIDRSYWANEKSRATKSNNPLRPNLIKGSAQPILIVRPQQAIRELPIKSVDDSSRLSPRRSKSASPHLRANRNMNKLDNNSSYTYEDDNDNDGKQPRPHPIFKRGSLVSSDSVEYAGSATKRVSFSNQNVGNELPNGNWPTKHGTASEPPTRRHRSEDSVSDTDSVFIRDPNLDIIYTPYHPNTSCSRNLEASYAYHRIPQNNNKCVPQEYDADRPLPPLPKEPSNVTQAQRWNVVPHNYRKWPALCESESGSEAAGEVQRIFGRNDGIPIEKSLEDQSRRSADRWRDLSFGPAAP